MLGLPEKGMARSVKQHNVDLNVICDWIEASAVFDDSPITNSEAVDVLMENGVYEKQDFAAAIVGQGWAIVSERIKLLGAPLGLKASKNRITRLSDWKTSPAYSFCMALSCGVLYPKWADNWDAPSVRGELFEELTEESLSKSFAGWAIRRVGWSPDNSVKLKDTISKIISDLNEVPGAEMDLYVDSHANELGLDLLAYYSFGDPHASIPVLLVQCASGWNWRQKRHTPDLNIWHKVVSFNSNPVKAFAMPFAFADPVEFRKDTMTVKGIFVDRNRLIRALRNEAGQVSEALGEKLVKWVGRYIDTVPRDQE